MAKMQKLEGVVELQCSAEEIFEITRAKQAHIPEVCSHRVANVEAHEDDWVSMGSIRKWDFIIDGKKHALTERIEEVDECNRTIIRKVIEGDFLEHYTTLSNKIEVIPKGKNCCVMKYSLDYEKVHEAAPEPRKLFDFALGLFKDIGRNLSN